MGCSATCTFSPERGDGALDVTLEARRRAPARRPPPELPSSANAKGAAMNAQAILPNVLDHCQRGTQRQERGDFGAALADFEQAVALGPSCVEALNGRGMTRHLCGDLAGAIADYNEVLRLSPDHAPACNNRGLARHAQGDHAGAV